MNGRLSMSVASGSNPAARREASDAIVTMRDGAELALRFPLPKLFVDGLTVEKKVMVRLRYADGGGSRPLTIGWLPVGVGPLLGFEGTLGATPDSESTCRLTIAGSYTPPGGIAGVVFDQFIGVHIANATVTALVLSEDHAPAKIVVREVDVMPGGPGVELRWNGEALL